MSAPIGSPAWHEECRDLSDTGPFYRAPSMEGVSLHTGRTCHWRVCPECHGAGTVAIDKRGEYAEVRCPNPQCDDGDVVEWVDPLIQLRDARRDLMRSHNRRSPWANQRYGECMAAALSPESFLPGDPEAVVVLRAAA